MPGIIGLGPASKDDDSSIVNTLFKQGRLEEHVVGLNIEDALAKGYESSISLGFLDYKAVEKGEDGLSWYTNKNADSWTVSILRPMKYGGIDLATTNKAPVAHIDSGNVHIKVPEDVFNQMKRMMQVYDPTMKEFK